MSDDLKLFCYVSGIIAGLIAVAVYSRCKVKEERDVLPR